MASVPINCPSRRMWNTAPGEGRVGVGQLDELDLYLRVILKNERYVRFAVPIEFLTDFAGVLAQRVAVGRRHFFRHIAADGHGIPRHIRECAARPVV